MIDPQYPIPPMKSRDNEISQTIIIFQKENLQYEPRSLTGKISLYQINVNGQNLSSNPYRISDYLVGSILLMYLDTEKNQLFPLPDLPLSLSVNPEYATNVADAIKSVKGKLTEKTTQLKSVLKKIQTVKNPQQIAKILQEINLEKIVPINLVEKYHRPIYYNIELKNPEDHTVKSVKLRCQVDPGAYTSICAPDFAEKLNLKPFENLDIRGALHGSESVPVCRMKIRLHGKECETKVLILPDVRSRFGGPFAIGQELFNWDCENRGIKLELNEDLK